MSIPDPAIMLRSFGWPVSTDDEGRTKADTLRHYQNMVRESERLVAVSHPSSVAEIAAWASEGQERNHTFRRAHGLLRDERGSVALSLVTVAFTVFGLVMVAALLVYGAMMGSSATPKPADHYKPVRPPSAAVVRHVGISPASVVATVNSGMKLCLTSHATNCHAELDSDGSVSVYGDYPNVVPTGATVRAKVSCQEDDPCWNCKTMGNRICGKP